VNRKNRLLALAGLLLTVSLATTQSVFCAGAGVGAGSDSVSTNALSFFQIEKADINSLQMAMLSELEGSERLTQAKLLKKCLTELIFHTDLNYHFDPENPEVSLQLCSNNIAKIQILLQTTNNLALKQKHIDWLKIVIKRLNDYISIKGQNNPWLRPIITTMVNNLTSLAYSTAATAAPSLPVVEPEALASRRPATASTTVSEGPAGAGSGAGAASVSTPAISEGTAGAAVGAGSDDTSREAYDAIKRKLARYAHEGANAPATLFKDIAVSISNATADNQMVRYGENTGAILNAMMEETAAECLVLMNAYGVVPTSADFRLLQDVQTTLALNLGAESSAAESLLQVINKAKEVMARPKAAVTTPASAGAGAGASEVPTVDIRIETPEAAVLRDLKSFKLDDPNYVSTVKGESKENCKNRRTGYIFSNIFDKIKNISETKTLMGLMTSDNLNESLKHHVLKFKIMIENDFLPSQEIFNQLKMTALRFAARENPLFSPEQKEAALRLVHEIKILLITKGLGETYWPECDVCSGRMTRQEASVNPDARICMDDGTARGAGAGAGSSGK